MKVLVGCEFSGIVRDAFPSEFGGMYDKAEVDTGMIDAEYMEVEA